jgi:hypothetical protein
MPQGNFQSFYTFSAKGQKRQNGSLFSGTVQNCRNVKFYQMDMEKFGKVSLIFGIAKYYQIW